MRARRRRRQVAATDDGRRRRHSPRSARPLVPRGTSRSSKHAPLKPGQVGTVHAQKKKKRTLERLVGTCRDAFRGSAEQVSSSAFFFHSSSQTTFFLFERLGLRGPKENKLLFSFFSSIDAPRLGLVLRADTGAAPGLCVIGHGRARILRAGRAGERF